MKLDIRLGLIGAGNMAEAIVRGALAAKVLPASRIRAADPVPERRALFESLGVAAGEDNGAVVTGSDMVLLAVKPQSLDAVLPGLRGSVGSEHRIVSICAGVPTSRIEKDLPPGTRVVRVMPNTPMLVGEGAAALVRGAHATASDLEEACVLFAAAAKVVVRLESEALMDAVTALSGSGPAYVFYLVERMVEGAVAEGMNPDDALRLANQTVAGAAALLQRGESRGPEESPAALRHKVTSPGGTTQAALEYLEAHSVGEHLTAAVRRAAERSRELGS